MTFGSHPHSRETVNAIYALRGISSASIVGEQFGMTRNAVIGLWNRERKRRGDGVMVRSEGRPRKLTDEDRLAAKRRRGAAARLRVSIERAERAAKEASRPQLVWHVPTPTIAAQPANDGRGVAFVDLERRSCRFPLGGPTEPAMAFCGAKSVNGYPYCVAHMRVAYLPAHRQPTRSGNVPPISRDFMEAAE